MMGQGRPTPASQYPNRLVDFFDEDFYSKNRRAGGRQLNGERNAVKALTHASSERGMKLKSGTFKNANRALAALALANVYLSRKRLMVEVCP
jgi:hypothetical protein